MTVGDLRAKERGAPSPLLAKITKMHPACQPAIPSLHLLLAEGAGAEESFS